MSQQQQQNNVFQIQQQIKQNAEEMNEYLSDLKNWVKQKSSPPSSQQQQDQSSSSTTTTTTSNRTLPPIRNTTSSSPTLTKKPLIEQQVNNNNNKSSSTTTTTTTTSKNKENEEEPNEVQALSLKNQGNHFFRNKQFEKALEYYTKSLSFKQDAIVYCNRSAAHFQLDQFSSSELDSSKAIALDHSYAKAYARRAFARKELKNWEGSIQDFEMAIKLDPKNQEAVRELALVKKRWNEQQGENLPKRRMMIEEVDDEEVDENDDDENQVIEELVTPFASKLESSKSKLREEKEVKTEPSSVKSERDSGATQTRISSPSSSMTKVEQQKSMTTSAIPKIKVKIPSHAPNNSYEFEKAFNELDREDFYEYLKMIPPNSFGKLFKESLTEKILNSIVEALESVFTRTEELAERALQVMSNLTRVGRFDMLVMFLNDEEKQRIERLFDSLQQKLPSDKIGELKQVRAKYA